MFIAACIKLSVLTGAVIGSRSFQLSDRLTEDEVLAILQQVVDPELGINIVDLGLVYEVEIAEYSLSIAITMTSPSCPLVGFLEKEARIVLQDSFPALSSVYVETVWEPQWSPLMMSWAARQQIGWTA